MRTLVVETTNICDAHCVTCPREYFKQHYEVMEMSLFTKIAHDPMIHNIKSLYLFGFGDCFLDKHLFKRQRYLKNRLHINIVLNTTGFYMDVSKWVEIADYTDTLIFSICGTNKKVYETFHRGKIKYEISMNNILGFLDFIKYRQRKPHTIGWFIETDLNTHQKEEWVLFWREKLDDVFIWKPHSWIQYRKYRNINHTCQKSCGKTKEGFYIHVDGMVSPCSFDINKQILIGDIKTQTLEEINEASRVFMQKHDNNDFTGLICQNCDQTNWRYYIEIIKHDSLHSLFGHNWVTVYFSPFNVDLRKFCPNPDLILPGINIWLPDSNIVLENKRYRVFEQIVHTLTKE